MTAIDKKKQLAGYIKQQHKIFTEGCGSTRCHDENCVSSGKVSPLDSNAAFKKVIESTSKSIPEQNYLSSHLVYSLVKHSPEPLYDILYPLLRRVLSDPYKLSSSFRQAGLDKELQTTVTIDKDEVQETWECLFSVKNPDLDEVIAISLGAMAEKLHELLQSKEKSTLKEAKKLINSVVIFLLNPQLQNPEYADCWFSELCKCVTLMKNDFKINIIHYLSTLTSDEIKQMIYNFHQVIAISIATKQDDASLHTLRAACHATECLQLVYGAVIYRSQQTLPQCLGTLSRQASHDVPSPISTYTNVPRVSADPQVSSSPQPPVVVSSSGEPASSDPMKYTSSDTNNDVGSSETAKQPSTTTIIPAQTDENVGSSRDQHERNSGDGSPQRIDTVIKSDLDKREEKLGGDGSTPDDTRQNQTTSSPIQTPRSENNEEGSSLRAAVDFFQNILGTGLDSDLSDVDDPPTDDARLLLSGEIAEVDSDDEEESLDDTQEAVNAFANLLVTGFGRASRSRSSPKPPHKSQKLFKKLGIDPLWESHTDVDLGLFYNDDICENLKMDEDYIRYKMGREFSFLRYPFVLRPHIKSISLQFDNRMNMRREINPFNMILLGEMPFLKLTVRRNSIIEDALTHLEMVAEEDPSRLQRQLFVEFEGEEGVDEGGVQKEFFSLIIAELFNPAYAMFVSIEDTRMLWFNPESFEVEHNYKLIGMLLGLAVYNNVILDINFPTVLYQKLMGEKPDIRDLIQSHPLLGSSLQQLLDYPDNDVEDVFVLDFVASTTGLFGTEIKHELVKGGTNVPVTNANRNDFVDRYVNYILNTSVEKQFDQFKKGFDMVTDKSQLNEWFRPEELEKIIVGSPNLDFKELESVTKYDGGYTDETEVIKWFWEIVHSMTYDDQVKLLTFATGCGRAPVGGMAEMRFVIVKNGEDSERLPTAHTCFNVILLPMYSSKDKLKRKLYKAIQHFEGFGMI